MSIYKGFLIIILLDSWNICIPLIMGQNVEVNGSLKISMMDTIFVGDMVVVKEPDGTLAQRNNKLSASKTGDTLFNGTNWVIVPGISLANHILDGDGNEYFKITIGTQVWLTINLRTTKYNDGTPIPLVTNSSDWGNLTTPGYCWYNNDSTANALPYGALYNYYAIADTATKQVCPEGWHVPSDDEWATLVGFLEGYPVAGGKLKEEGTLHWNSPNTGATNSSGFTAVAGGNRNTGGVFDEFLGGAFFWSSTVYSPDRGWYHYLSTNSDDAYRDNNLKDIGFSVRCIKD